MNRRIPKLPKDPRVFNACPRCGDTENGYTYTTKVLDTRFGGWGEGSESADLTTTHVPVFGKCMTCGFRLRVTACEPRP